MPVDRARPNPYLSPVKKLEIITLPDRKLRSTSAPVERIDDETRRFLDEMLATMYEADGIGLAAIQVGVPRRIVTLDVAKREDENAERAPMFLVNPRSCGPPTRLVTREEGCLSIPEYYAEVERPARVRVRLSRPRRQAPGDRGERGAGDLPPARDRPPQRQALHRLPVEAEARHGDQEIHQAGAAFAQGQPL